MNDLEVIAQFRSLMATFKEQQKRFVLAIQNSDYNDPIFEAINNLVIEIKEKSTPYDILRVDDLTLRNELVAIRENKGFVYFEILKILQRHLGESKDDKLTFAPNWEEFYENRWDDIMHAEIFSQVNPHTLIMRKMELGTLLVGKKVPEHLRTHLRQIKECYAWGFETEASIYCRTILEEGFREALRPKPEFRSPQQRRDLEGWRLDWLLNHSKRKKYFYAEVIERAYNIKENVNHIVHPSARKPAEQMSNLEIIKDMFYILEMLFR
ncbi:MAG: hypothetical protein COS87_02175 [Chloroflexi bacterium CG07_land_8_20_14_0_80_45_17]|nr:MAG: hypothetical protein COS87_02175 [Chloroflexi bacterium CG07_land_8_20_14_0_80_45_17]